MVKFLAMPFYLSLVLDGKTATCVYAYSVAVFDMESAKVILDFPSEKSVLVEVEYIDNHRIAYAGAGGMQDIELFDETSGYISFEGRFYWKNINF